MGRPSVLKIDIVADAIGAAQGARTAERAFDGLTGKLAKLAGGLALASFATSSVKAASEVQQSFGGMQAVFKSGYAAMYENATRAADAVGLSQAAYSQMATVLGAGLKNQGVAMDQLGPITDKLITRGADLASMFGGTTADAVEALTAAFRGEADPAERYGLNLSQTAVNAYKAAHASEKLTDTQARMALIMAQSKDSAGNFAKEAGTLEGQQQRLSAAWENAKVVVGNALLPILTSLYGIFNTALLPAFQRCAEVIGEAVLPVIDSLGSKFDDWGPKIQAVAQSFVNGLVVALSDTASALTATSDWIQRNWSWLQYLVVALGGAAAAWAAWTLAITIWTGVTKAAAAIQAAFNAVMALNPVMVVVVALGALAAALIYAYGHCDTFRSIVDAAWGVLRKLWDVGVAVVKFALTPLRAAFDAVSLVVGPLMDILRAVGRWFAEFVVPPAITALKAVFEGIEGQVTAVWNAVKKLGDLLSNLPGAGVLKSIVGKVFSADAPPDAGLYYSARDGRPVIRGGVGSTAVLKPQIFLSVTIDGSQLQGRITSTVGSALAAEGARLVAGAWS